MPVADLQDALDCLQNRDVEAVIEVLEHKIAVLPTHVAAYVLLARAYEADEQWDQALQAWQEVRFLLPNSPAARKGAERVLRSASGRDQNIDLAPASIEALTDVERGTDRNAPPDDASDPSTDSNADLEALRRRADQEAPRGGPHPSDVSPSSTPEEQVEHFEATEDSDLDRLIDELESAQIEPDSVPDDVPEPDLDDNVEDIVSETLAKIHASQGHYREAARIYSKLASQEPERAQHHRKKAVEMADKADAGGEDD